MSDATLLFPFLLLFLGIALLVISRQRRLALLTLPGKLVYQDTREEPGTTLYAHTYRLKGRPDFLIRQGEATIPVEVKMGRTPEYPFPGHVMQLVAYCVLVEENYSVRPPYGVIRYPERQFTIDFTEELREQLIAMLADMEAKRGAEGVPRSHNNPRQCAACGFRDLCDQRLSFQQRLPFEG